MKQENPHCVNTEMAREKLKFYTTNRPINLKKKLRNEKKHAHLCCSFILILNHKWPGIILFPLSLLTLVQNELDFVEWTTLN